MGMTIASPALPEEACVGDDGEADACCGVLLCSNIQHMDA